MPDLFALLVDDHRVIGSMIRRLTRLDDAPSLRAAVFAELEERWLAHADAEEELVLAPLAGREDLVRVVAAVRSCHAAIERVLDHLGSLDPEAEGWAEGLSVLDRLIGEHVTEVEARLFEHAGSALDPTVRRALAAEYHATLRELTSDAPRAA
jgi:hypothetical protein